MQKHARLTAICAVATGVVGYILRRLQLLRAFEPDTGLPVSGAAATVALVAYAVIVFAAGIVLARVISNRFALPKNYRQAAAPSNEFTHIAALLVGVVLVIAAVLTYLAANKTEMVPSASIVALHGRRDPKLQTIISGLMLVVGVTVFALEHLNFRQRGNDTKQPISPAAQWVVILPELAVTVWLVLFYRENQINPVRMTYAFRCLALAASAFAFYFQTGCVFSRPMLGRLTVAHIAAVFFLVTASADHISIELTAGFLALALYFAISLARFLANADVYVPDDDADDELAVSAATEPDADDAYEDFDED